jgi:hypothetical protein
VVGQTGDQVRATRVELGGRLTRLEAVASSQLAQLEKLNADAEAASLSREGISSPLRSGGSRLERVTGAPAAEGISQDNVPLPLRNAPSRLFAETAHVMSFGERAALEGLLSELKPRVAVEIGTFKGGSLRRIAAHSRHVDSFDLYDLVVDKRAFRNVRFFTGDSKARVPPVLARYAEQGVAVDFVHIDGDHSADGVRADLMNILTSPACARTVIVLHDAMNAEVRSGIESVGLAGHPRVVYVELDFVAGYEFVGGSWHGQRWGGLGLVITGDRTSDGYGDRPIQTRYVPTFDILKDEHPPAPQPDGHAPAGETAHRNGR